MSEANETRYFDKCLIINTLLSQTGADDDFR